MPKAISAARKAPTESSRRRVSKIATARDTLAEFDHGIEVDVLTFGQFSIIDAIEAVLEKTGPAHVTLATWTAAEFDLSQLQAQILRAGILDLRMIIDRSFVSRHPKFVEIIRQKFGMQSVRTTKTHAKFVALTNENWNVLIRTSMNLNYNPRLEYLPVCDDAALCGMYLDVADRLFEEEDEGMDQSRGMPLLAGIDHVAPKPRVRMGRQPRVGASQ
jgi:hypothetical protein